MNTLLNFSEMFHDYPLEKLTQLDWKTVTYSGAIMFTPSGKIVCIRQRRGIDIPGGHTDPHESPYETLCRETKEEIGYDIEQSQVIYIREGKKSYKGIEKPKLVYSMVENCSEEIVKKSFADRAHEHAHEASSVCFLDPEEFLDEYRSTRTLSEQQGFVKNMECAIHAAVAARENKKMHVGLVALGDHQIRGHLLPLQTDTRVDKILAFDPNISNALSNLDKHNLASPKNSKIDMITSNFDRLSQDPLVQVVFISSPDQFHIPQMTEMLHAGKHVFCEKPLIHTPEEVDKLVENILYARNRGLILSSCHPRRFDRPFVWLKEFLAKNKSLGKIKRINFDFEYPLPEDGKEGLHSGLLSDHFNHEIDLVTFYLGWDHFFAEKLHDSQTYYEAKGIREDGVQFHFTGKRNKPRGSAYAESITLITENGSIQVDTETGKATLVIDEDSTVVGNDLYTDYIGRFQKTTSNFIGAIVAGERNYLTSWHLLMNNLSGAILSSSSTFSSQDYLHLLQAISE